MPNVLTVLLQWSIFLYMYMLKLWKFSHVKVHTLVGCNINSTPNISKIWNNLEKSIINLLKDKNQANTLSTYLTANSHLVQLCWQISLWVKISVENLNQRTTNKNSARNYDVKSIHRCIQISTSLTKVSFLWYKTTNITCVQMIFPDHIEKMITPIRKNA